MKIPKRRKLSKEERMKVYEKCQGHCAYCGCSLEYKDMQVDHVNPIRCDGEDDISNMLPACRSCNHYKSTLKPEEFKLKFPSIFLKVKQMINFNENYFIVD